MIRSVLRQLSRAGCFNSGADPDRLRVVQISSSKLRSGRVVFLVFAPEAYSPTWVIKIQKNEQFQHLLLREVEERTTLRKTLPADLAESVPPVLAVETVDGHTVLLEPGISGRTLGHALKPGNHGTISRDFDTAYRWIGRLQAATKSQVTAAEAEALLMRPVEDLRRCWAREDLGDVPDRLTAAVQRILDACGSSMPPLVYRQGDYFAKNILIRSDSAGPQLSVLDWEFGAANQLPWFDPLFFATTYCQLGNSNRGLGIPAMFRQMFFNQDHWLADIARSALIRWAEAAGVDVHWLRVGFLLMLAEMSTRDVVTSGLHGPNDYQYLNHLREACQIMDQCTLPSV